MIPSEGTLKIKGLDVANRASEVHAITGYMPHRFGLYEDPAVIENLNLYADLQGLLGKERKSIFERLLTFTRLSPFTDRLALACALMHRPSVFFLDEPTSGVDPITRREFRTLIYAGRLSSILRPLSRNERSTFPPMDIFSL